MRIYMLDFEFLISNHCCPVKIEIPVFKTVSS
jgi:hypothetical protein